MAVLSTLSYYWDGSFLVSEGSTPFDPDTMQIYYLVSATRANVPHTNNPPSNLQRFSQGSLAPSLSSLMKQQAIDNEQGLQFHRRLWSHRPSSSSPRPTNNTQQDTATEPVPFSHPPTRAPAPSAPRSISSTCLIFGGRFAVSKFPLHSLIVLLEGGYMHICDRNAALIRGDQVGSRVGCGSPRFAC